ncbi:hypothetical protein [Zobellella denitrificans]|nr:hypothetical protein [Zobellella denitrificans]
MQHNVPPAADAAPNQALPDYLARYAADGYADIGGLQSLRLQLEEVAAAL